MAAGDITFDAGQPVGGSHAWVATGTVEADTTLRAFALTGGSILDLQLTGEDDAVGIKSQINKNASGVATSGTAAISTNVAEAAKLRFRMEFVM